MLAVLDMSDLGLIACIVLICTAALLLRPMPQIRMARLERKLDLILKHMQIAVPDPTTVGGLSDEVRRLIDAGDKIKAIRRHREETGISLASARDVINAYLASRR